MSKFCLLVLLLALVACGGGGDDEPDETVASTQPVRCPAQAASCR